MEIHQTTKNSSNSVILEYIWLDGHGELRSKYRTIYPENGILNVDVWNYDGSSTYQAEISKYNNPESIIKKERSLYPYFIKPKQESLVAHYLEKQAKPMSAEERIYFGFSESGISRAVCV